jgi:hypothetical protein
MEPEKDIWIFLSHSNKDYELVKIVRDKLEDCGRRPIMFFLKCLDDDIEIFELIKREIDARSRFILCRSHNTEESNGWVQKEFKYIQEQNKPYEIVDLNDAASFDATIARLIRRSNVFISSSVKDKDFSHLLARELTLNSFDVSYLNNDFSTDALAFYEGRLSDVSDSNIMKKTQSGYVLCLWSEPLTSIQQDEFEMAVRNSTEGFVIPLVINSEAHTSWEYFNEIGHSFGIRVIDAASGTVKEKVQMIVSELKRLDILKNNREVLKQSKEIKIQKNGII